MSHFEVKCMGFDIDIRVLKGISHANVVAAREQILTDEAVSEVQEGVGIGMVRAGKEKQKQKEKEDKGTRLKNLDRRTIWDNFK